MTKCVEFGCRSIKMVCQDCGRMTCTVDFPKEIWISVKDRLPEHYDEVVVCTDFGFNIAYYTGYSWLLEEDGCTKSVDVNLWMPLSKPPVIEEEEE